MKFTLSWLKDHLETEAGVAEIAERLTAIGLEVEEITDPAAGLEPFIIGYVEDAWKHPNADRLKVCQVSTGAETVQVICGAPNARKGMKGVFAAAGSYVPGTDHHLKAGEIRGEASNGMLCSERELGLSDEHDGIIDLPEDAPVGESFAAYRGLNDPVIEIGITPDRADCLGVYGIARDLAAAGLGILKAFDRTEIAGSYESPMAWRIDEHALDGCPYVAGRHFRNLTNGPSPDWMQRRLTAIGLRPISALVDITNYVTYDLGRPLHVFDAKTVKGDPTMRRARDGDTILALDGKDYTLTSDMVAIYDENGPEGIAGVMGGEETGCTLETTEAFLEVALFDPVMVAETGRALGINSDARYRFERGLDPESAAWGVHVATRLIQQLCGGDASTPVSAGTLPKPERRLDLRIARMTRHSGLEVPVEEAEEALKGLGFETEISEGAHGPMIHTVVPSWRHDVETEYCLIEEVLRIKGFDSVPARALRPSEALPGAAIGLQQRRDAFAKKVLAQRGMLEAVTWSFMPGDLAILFRADDGFDRAAMTLANPISADLDVMRPSILPNLIQAAARNADRGAGDVALFEVGPAFRDPTPTGQDTVAAGIRAGKTGERSWTGPVRDADAFDAKADALAVLEACGAPVANLQVSLDAPDWYHPGRAGTLRLGPTVLAWFGELHPGLARKLDLRGRAAVFEIFMERIPKPRGKSGGKSRPLLKTEALLPVGRDFAFLVDAGTAADALARAAAAADKKMIAGARVFDVYEGPELDGAKSVAVAVTIQPTEKTLTDPEIDAIAGKIVANVEKLTGGKLRG
ncbi:MAG: phenylalanine--tRNA ligase subunit beta [Alphaproteobacteria bacterium]|nr:phenylalanine--tRNA ligase subunit beta [Alphaproteobacteria bacterium]